MARWKLQTSHYLNTLGGVEWEYSAVQSGKSVRRRFPVPRYLDINDPGDWTLKVGSGLPVEWGGNDDSAGGIIVVCKPGAGSPGDIEFTGDPSPNMLPLDGEAKAISDSFRSRWNFAPSDEGISHSQMLVDAIEDLKETQLNRPPETVKIEGLDTVLAQLAATQKLIADALISQHQPSRRA